MASDYRKTIPPLTPAAEETLRDVMGRLREDLLERAARNAASPFGVASEISVNDVLAAFRDLRPALSGPLEAYQQARQARRERLLWLYVVIGLGALAAGASIAFSTASSTGTIATAIAAAGGGVLTVSVAFMTLQRARRLTLGELVFEHSWSDPSDPSASVDYISESWLELELALRQRAASEFGESVASRPLSSLIDGLVSAGVLDQNDNESLRAVLRLRNEAAHGGRAPSLSEAKRVLSDVRGVLDKLFAPSST